MKLFYQEYTQESADLNLHPVVILHGMFGAGDNWMNIARAIGTVQQVWTVDLPGHGKSHDPLHPEINQNLFDYRSLALNLAECLAELPVSGRANPEKRFVLLGHSMGGKVAMALALLRPNLVKGLIVVDSAPRDYRSRNYNFAVLAMLREIDPSSFSSRLAVDTAMIPWIDDPIVRGFLLKNLQTAETGGLRWRFNAPVILAAAPEIADWPLEAATYPIFSGPVLFLAGELSDYIDPEVDGVLIRHFFPNAQIEVIAGARHWVHVDNKTDFLMQTNAFLSKLEEMGET